ncbi:MAG: SAM-dependent chlorinase/fluorinase [Alphaproteobacteria bacterium]
MPNLPLIADDGTCDLVIKILTDYPRDDLASDEVHQALVSAIVKHGLRPMNADVGAITGMDTVSAGFKLAQLALNSSIGVGHVYHANCAPRRNIVTAESKGERVVIGMLANGVSLLIVNSGFAMAPFRPLIEAGQAWFYESRVPDSGSQFRSRDFFPDATAAVAAHIKAKAEQLGRDAVKALVDGQQAYKLFEGLDLITDPLAADSLPELETGRVWYVDNFGNIKLNLKHDELLAWQSRGETLNVCINGHVAPVLVSGAGFSQGEGVMAITRGSSGWSTDGGKPMRFAEIFLRGGSASGAFAGVNPGDQVTAIARTDLEAASKALRAADPARLMALGLFNMNEAQLIALFEQSGLICDGFNATRLRRALDDGDLLDRLEAYHALRRGE